MNGSECLASLWRSLAPFHSVGVKCFRLPFFHPWGKDPGPAAGRHAAEDTLLGVNCVHGGPRSLQQLPEHARALGLSDEMGP